MQSIKWRFVLIYFLLVLAVLLIVASSITGRLESSLIEDKVDNVKSQMISMIATGGYFQSEDLAESYRGIRASLTERRFQNDEDIYVILDEDFPTILAAKSNYKYPVDNLSVSNVEELRISLINVAFDGEMKQDIVEGEQGKEAHLVVPIVGKNSKIKGVVYGVLNLTGIDRTLNRAKRIMLSSSLVALFITILLSYMIASGITNPIRRVTEVAKQMSQGDFKQRVQVKSRDEIGRLGDMFNFLTVELERNMNRMEMEQAKLNTIFNQMAEGVVAINSLGTVIHMNDRARDLFRIHRDVPEEDISLTFEEMGIHSVTFQNPYTLEGEEELTMGERTYKVIYAPFEDRALKVGGLIVVYQDMTKERKLEEMRREFVANVSHELKTPITSIKSYAETLMEHPVDGETAKNFLQVIDRESDRMAHIVRDLLTLTTLDYKTEEKELEFRDVSRIAKAAVDRVRVMFAEKNQALYEDYEDHIYSLTDGEDLLQVVINLLSNASKYTPEGGVIRISSKQIGKENHISIADNGIGIPTEDQAHIFERFYRVEKSRSRNMGGTGLGLAIAKEMMETLQGEIRLESSPGKGSTFTIVLPAVEEENHGEK